MVDDGAPVTDVQVLDRVHALGATFARRGPVEGLDFVNWRRELRRAAKTRGFRISVNQLGDQAVVISNPDHVVTDAQRRAAVERMALPPGLPHPQVPHGVRLVADHAPKPSPARRQRPPR